MTEIIDCSAALVAPPRPRAPFAGARLHADDAQPRLRSGLDMSCTGGAWRRVTGSTMRGLELAAQQGTQDGRTGVIAGTYVTANAAVKQHFSTRSGPPTPRPPA